jgi:8-oxo-dGTP pyrophosphatase MutT (NUDIX family)
VICDTPSRVTQSSREQAPISGGFMLLFDGLREALHARLASIDSMQAMSYFNPKRLSCGVVILTTERELLLCHVTGQSHWDLPKGGIDFGESPIDAAVRETREETGLELSPEALLDLGRLPYTNKKNLHLFATVMPRIDLAALHCESRYLDRHSGRDLPEMDGYGWFVFERAQALCTPNMAQVLGVRLDLDNVLVRALGSAQPATV